MRRKRVLLFFALSVLGCSDTMASGLDAAVEAPRPTDGDNGAPRGLDAAVGDSGATASDAGADAARAKPSGPAAGTCAGERCGLPTGIPDPAGRVPAAIMPSLPVRDDQIAAFPYDPIGLDAPSWGDGPDQYYVNSADPACDDEHNGGRGEPEAPRCTIPGIARSDWTLQAGTQVFLVGDGAVYGDGSGLNTMTMVGTAEAPIWIIGVGDTLPELRFGKMEWQEGRHVLFDSVHFRSETDDFRMLFAGNGPAEYFTFRHVKCSGSDGIHSEPSRRCFSLGGSPEYPLRFVVFHDLEAWGLGRWQDDRDTDRDLLGIQIQKWVRYVWLLDSRIYHIQGDSIMCGNSNWWDFDHASRPHYIYVGRNEFFENYENAYDQKGCYHVVFSENDVHDYYNAAKGANNTAIITEQDSEGDVGGRFGWFLNNTVHRAGNPIAAKATTDDAYIYILGNLFREFDDVGLIFTQRCYNGGSQGQTCPSGLTFAHNTMDCGNRAAAISNVQNPSGSQQTVEIDGNVFLDCVDGGRGSPHGWESFSDEPLTLSHVQNAHHRSAGGDIMLIGARYDRLERNLLNQPLMLLDPENGDYRLGAGSPARGLVSTPNAAYELFESMYGLDIRRDLAGATWGEPPLQPGALQ